MTHMTTKHILLVLVFCYMAALVMESSALGSVFLTHTVVY